MSLLSEGLKSLGTGFKQAGTTVKSGYSDIEDSVNKNNPMFSRVGSSVEDYLLPRTPEIMGVGGKDLWRVFWDPTRDNPISVYENVASKVGNVLQGKKVFDDPGDVEYNQNLLKRAAIVASVFGGVAAGGAAAAPSYGVGAGNVGGLGLGLTGSGAAGGGSAGLGLGLTEAGVAGAGTGSTAALASSPMLAGTSTVPVAGGFGSMASVPMAGVGAAAPAATYGASAGATGGLGLTSAGMAGGGMAGGMAPTMAGAGGAGLAGGAGAAAPVVAGGGGGGGGAATAGSWAPYAMAGGSILSTLFSGLMQMQQAEEQRQQEIKMARAKSNIERAQAENAALDRLIQIWGRR